jgi:hypothetical protein
MDEPTKPGLKVVQFTGPTRIPTEPDIVLDELKGQLSYVLVIGWGLESDGQPLIAASSSSDLREAFYALENYKFATLNSKWEGHESVDS